MKERNWPGDPPPPSAERMAEYHALVEAGRVRREADIAAAATSEKALSSLRADLQQWLEDRLLTLHCEGAYFYDSWMTLSKGDVELNIDDHIGKE